MQRQEGKSRCCEMDFCPPVLRCPRLDPSSLFNNVPCVFFVAMSPPGASALLLKDENPKKNSETNCYPSHTKDRRKIINEWSVNLKIVLPVKLFENNNLAAFFLFIFLWVPLVLPGEQYICYLFISLLVPQFSASFSPVDFSVLYYSFLSFKIGRSGYVCTQSWFTWL